MLPIQEDSKIVSFQIDNLDSFATDFEIFPTFGSKVIAKTVALPNIFSAPLAAQVIAVSPFRSTTTSDWPDQLQLSSHQAISWYPLEITHFATYWKATSQLDSHPSALITGSSLSGEYAQLFVQLTSDGIPVLYPQWTITHHEIDFPIGRLTYKQFVAIGLHRGSGDEILASLWTGPWMI
jgi:CDK inhibitor PHO81